MLRRWLKFNFVGLIGVGVQLLALHLLTRYAGLNYLMATAIAVETAIIHNFLWHERFTWKQRDLSSESSQRFRRFLRFNMANGVVSLTGNLLLMKILSGYWGWPYLAANVCSIVACALINFYLSDRHVFTERTSS